MDSTGTNKSILEQMKKHKFQVLLLIALVAGITGVTVSVSGSKGSKTAKSEEHAQATHPKQAEAGRVNDRGAFEMFRDAVVSVQAKVDELKRADEENERLRQENAHLRLVLESEHYARYAEKAQSETQTFQWKLSKETGSKTGRTLASIGYKVPQDLLPAQLYTLGMSYFKMREDEKAAVIFTFLTGLESDSSFKTATNYLMAGISWYRVENFELADFYFDQILHLSENQGNHRVQGQARIWKGLVSERTGKHTKAQFWLHDVLDHDPHSVEARWVNSANLKRTPAAQEKSEGPNEAAHETASD